LEEELKEEAPPKKSAPVAVVATGKKTMKAKRGKIVRTAINVGKAKAVVKNLQPKEGNDEVADD
jgi:hypothetical protein